MNVIPEIATTSCLLGLGLEDVSQLQRPYLVLVGALLLTAAVLGGMTIGAAIMRARQQARSHRTIKAQRRLRKRFDRLIATGQKDPTADQDMDNVVPKEGIPSRVEGKTVLIADDDPEILNTLSLRLKQLQLQTVRTTDALYALCGAHRVEPDLMILDVNMPSGNGLAVCELLKTDRTYHQIPVIIYTSCSSRQTIQRCRDLGAHYVLKAPGAWSTMRELVLRLLDDQQTEDSLAGGRRPADAVETSTNTMPTSATSMLEGLARSQQSRTAAKQTPLPQESAGDALTEDRNNGTANSRCDVAHHEDVDRGGNPCTERTPPQGSSLSASLSSHAQEQPPAPAEDAHRPRVLVIDDDPEISRIIAMRLQPLGAAVHRAFSGMQGFWMGVDLQPDVVICDLSMPDGEGGYIFGRFKDHPLTKDTPIIVLTGHDHSGLRRQLLSQGAAAYLTKPLTLHTLIQELQRYIPLCDPARMGRREEQHLMAEAIGEPIS